MLSILVNALADVSIGKKVSLELGKCRGTWKIFWEGAMKTNHSLVCLIEIAVPKP